MKQHNFTKTIKHYLSIQQFFCIAVIVCMLFSGLNINAQDNPEELEITGIVTDAATKLPLIGARVAIAENTDISVLTDETGAYKIKVPSLGAVLSVTAFDHTLREVPLQGKRLVNVELYSDAFSSGYEKIDVLAGVERKSILTNPVSISTDFANSTSVSIESDIQSRLGGDVRTITRSGAQGVGAAMFIRGLNSLNANAQPLIIVDGVVWDNQLNNSSVHQGFFSNPLTNIDLKDIASVSVIRDGTSIYGSKASNGVIMINTVRGNDQTTKITASVSMGLNTKPDLPPMMNASEYRAYASNQVQGWLDHYKFSEAAIPVLFRFLDNDPTKSYYKTYHNDTDWADEVYQNGLLQNYGVSVSGGDDVALYNFSIGYTKNEGTLKETSMDRLNARFNSDINLSSKLFTKVDVSVSRTNRDLRDDGINQATSPGYLSLIKAPILSSHRYILSTGLQSPKLSDYDNMDPDESNALSNPVALVENALGTASRVGFNIKVNPYFKFNKNLTMGTVFSYSFNRVKESFFIPEAGVAPQFLANFNYLKNEVRDLAQRQSSIFSDTRLDWKVNLNKDNHLSLLGGFRYMSDEYESDMPKGYDTGNDNVKVLVKGLTAPSVTGVNNSWKSMSWYANAIYDYQNKYILELTASMDASSRFGEKTDGGIGLFGERWAIFPSVAGAWIASSEDFMKDVTAINYLKLRASYGMTGNDDIDPYAGRSYFRSVNYIDQAVGLELANIQNKAIQWETSKKWNVGLDTHLFNERLALSADYYNSATDNLLTQKKLKSIAGLAYYWDNGGKLENKGYEISMNAKVLSLRNVSWELGASVGHYKNEITSLPDGDYTTIANGATILTAVGHPMGVFYGYKTDGVYATTAEAESAGLYRQDASGAKHYYSAGDVRFVNTNDDKVIDEADKQVIGDPNPDIYGTITNKFQVKRFTLDVLFTYSSGNDVYNHLRAQLESGATFYNQSTAMLNRWTTEGQVTSVPRAVYGDPMGNNVFSDRWIEDGSYLRLKTVTLSYDIPIKMPFLQGMTVWASASNLWTWTKYLGSDPEFSMSNSALYQGIDVGLTPQSKSYLVGVKINL